MLGWGGFSVYSRKPVWAFSPSGVRIPPSPLTENQATLTTVSSAESVAILAADVAAWYVPWVSASRVRDPRAQDPARRRRPQLLRHAVDDR
jgi:hypothetical protein